MNLPMLPVKILLVSADVSLTRYVSACLNRAGYKIIHSASGAEVIDLVSSEHPALVVLDNQLPDYHSLAIIRTMRIDENNHRVPIILMGASLKEADVLMGLEVGADLCLVEVFNPQVFVARVRSLLRRAESLKSI